MKYICATFVAVAFLITPILVSAETNSHTNITPIEEYVVMELEGFQKHLQRSDLSRGELVKAFADIARVLEVYAKTL